MGRIANAQLIYETLPHEARWDVVASPVECSISQPIDGYGTAKLVQQAGRNARFQLDAFRSIHQSGQASLVARPGAWRPGQSGRFIKTIQTTVERPAIDAQGSVVQDAINTLLEAGKWW